MFLVAATVSAGVSVTQASATGWEPVLQCVVNSSGGHQFCNGYSSGYSRFQFRSKPGSLNKPFTWLQKRFGGSLTWGPSAVTNNDSWWNVPNVLYGTGYTTDLLVDNQHSGGVDGVYQNNAYVP